ncbi:MAG: hypothetical protein ABI120_26185, partial [Gemmatimonadaceae bacterium]
VAKRPQTISYASLDDYVATSQALTPGLTDRIHSLSLPDGARLRELVRSNVQPFMRGETVQLMATPICCAGQA